MWATPDRKLTQLTQYRTILDICSITRTSLLPLSPSLILIFNNSPSDTMPGQEMPSILGRYYHSTIPSCMLFGKVKEEGELTSSSLPGQACETGKDLLALWQFPLHLPEGEELSAVDPHPDILYPLRPDPSLT